MPSDVVLRRNCVTLRRAITWIALVVAWVAPANAQTGVVDSFNRADAGSLGIADSGQGWTSLYSDLSVEGGMAALPNGFGLVSINPGSSSLDVAVTVVQPGSEFWLVLRLADSQNYWRFGRWGSQAYVLQQIENNSLGSPSITDGATINAAPGDSLACSLRSNLIDCRVNGVMVARTTSTVGATAAGVGLSGYQSSTARFDNFSATPPAGPDLMVSLAGPSQLDFGAVGAWTTEIRNVGTASATSAVLVLTPSPAVSGISVQGASCGVTGPEWHCSLGTIGISQAVSVTLQAVAPNVIQQLVFSSRVDVIGDENDENDQASFSTQTRVPFPPGTRLLDSFNRANGPIGFADTGQQWSAYEGSLSILNSTVVSGNGFVLASVDSLGNAGELTTTVVTPTSEFWTLLRVSDSINYWRFGRWQGQPYQLQRIKANAAVIQPNLATVSAAAGDAVRCVYWLDQIECSVNGVLVARATDDFNESATRVGYSSYQTPGSQFDQLLVRQPPAIVDTDVSIAGPLSLRTGESAAWSIAVRNRGTVDASGTNVLISPPAALVALGLAGATCTPNGAQYQCAITALPAGGIVTVTLTGNAPATLGGLTVSASTPLQPGESNTGNNAQSFNTTVRPQIPANALVVDTFDRPNSATLGSADSGQAWTIHSGTPSTLGNEAVLGSGFVLATLNSGVSNADVSALLTNSSSEFWLVLRLSDSQNYWRFGRWQDGPYQLQQIRANALGAPSIQTLATIQPAVGDLLACRASAFLIECAVNNVAVVRTGDTFNRTATRVGFSGYQSAARFDELVVVHQPAGPDLATTVQAPSVALVNQNHSVLVRVRNNGDSPATGGQLVIALSPGAVVAQIPASCSISQQQITCAVASPLAPSGSQDFVLALTAASAVSLTGNAQASIAGDVFPSDNSAAWATAVVTADSGIFDSFSRPDTSSGLGSTLTGQAWQALSGNFRIDSGRARAIAAGALAAIEPGVSYGTLEVVLGDAPLSAAIAFRIVDANNYYRVAADEDGNYRINKVVNGVVQDMQYYILRHSTPVQPGDLVRVVTRPDDGVFVAVNGRHIIDAGDQQFMHASRWGLLAINGSPSFQSFAWRPELRGYTTVDAFSGPDGNPVTIPTSGVSYHWLTWNGLPWINHNGAARLAGDTYTVATLDTSSERASVSVKVVQPGTAGFVIFRYLEAGPYFRFGYEGGSTYTVEYLTADHMTASMPVAVQNLATRTPAAGDIIEVRQAADGTVECVVNGVVTHRFVDTVSGFRSTLTGLGANDTTVLLDDFTVTPLP